MCLFFKDALVLNTLQLKSGGNSCTFRRIASIWSILWKNKHTVIPPPKHCAVLAHTTSTLFLQDPITNLSSLGYFILTDIWSTEWAKWNMGALSYTGIFYPETMLMMQAVMFDPAGFWKRVWKMYLLLPIQSYAATGTWMATQKVTDLRIKTP